MQAGIIWKRFGAILRPQLEADPRLQELARLIQAGTTDRLLILMPLLYHAITSFLLQERAASHELFWYDDVELSRRYSGAQQLVVPVREESVTHLADLGWQAVERALRERPLATVLDLGTGDGVMARTFLTKRPEHIPRERVIICASDRSQAMLDTHAASFDAEGIKTLDATHGDMRGESWKCLETYRPICGPTFAGFDLLFGMMCFHIVPRRGQELYPGIAQILRPEGVVAFSHDFFDRGDSWMTYAPTHTLLEGYANYRRTSARPIGLVSYLAGFLLRRCFLQGDQLCTLGEECDAVARSFAHVRSERHERYREFAVILASREPLHVQTTHPAFSSGDDS